MTARDAALARWQARVGERIASPREVTVTQAMIDAFAQTTNDHQWIHVDPARAADTPFGGTIAHGFLTLSLASRFAYDCFPEEPGQVMGINYGFEKLRFLAPVPAGATLGAAFTLVSVKPRKTGELMREATLEMHVLGHETPALVAQWLALIVFDANS